MNIEQWFQVGNNAYERGLFEAAEHCYVRALHIDGRRPDIWASYADVLRRQWKFGPAWDAINYALSFGPFERGEFTAGCLALDSGDPVKALGYFTPRLCQTPYPRFVRSQALFMAGQFGEAFKEHEARIEMIPQAWKAPIPAWKGEDLTGKTLAVHHEQGYGDTICFAKYIDCLPANTLIGVPGPLTRLFKDQWGERVFNTNEPLPKADYVCPLMSVPAVLSHSEMIPAKPYICPQGRFDIPRDADTRLKVGIVWQAKSGQQNDVVAVREHGRQKTMKLEELLPLADIPGVQLYSLQTQDGSNEIKRLGADYLIHDLGPRIMDFHDLALFMKEMDIIVSVDTAPLHLAGALGVPTLGLIMYASGWPWLLGETSPWYSDAFRMIRQTVPWQWSDVVERVGKRLEAMISAQARPAQAAAAD